MKKLLPIVAVIFLLSACSMIFPTQEVEVSTVEPTVLPTEVATNTPLPTATHLPTNTPNLECLGQATTNINVRSGPGVEYNVIGIFEQDSYVIVQGTNRNATWLYINDGENLGWVYTELVRVEGNCTTLPVSAYSTFVPTSVPTTVSTHIPTVVSTQPAYPTYTPYPTFTSVVKPDVSNGSYSTNEDIPLIVPAPGILSHVSHQSGLVALLYTDEDHLLPESGELTLNSNGSFSYIPNENFNGTDAFLYRVWNGYNYSDVATITITVNPINDAPNLVSPGDQTNTESDTVLLEIGANDVDSTVLTFGASGLPDGLSIDPATGIISGTIATNTNTGSPYTVTIIVEDTDGLLDSITFSWTILQ